MAHHRDGAGLTLLAGPRALEMIRDGGLPASSVTTVLGAAGGPKWLVLVGLDRAIFFSWLSGAKSPIKLLGSSIGAWRFAAVAQRGRPAEAHEALREAYTRQRYDTKPSPQDVTDEAVRIMDAYLSTEDAASIPGNPRFSLSVISARGRGPFSTRRRPAVAAGMAAAGIANALSRDNLRRFFVRVVFADPGNNGSTGAPAGFGADPIPTESVALTAKNLRAAVLASGSIPMVMAPAVNVPGAREGYYWDGGLVDYHVTIPDSSGSAGEGIVLFPHYVDRIIPGWFDKYLPGRGPKPSAVDRVLLVAPSREFVERLPYGKIPDRTDFKRFFRDDRARIAFWQKVTDEGRRLADEFMELVESGRIRRHVRPFAEPGRTG